MREQGVEPADEYAADTPAVLAQLSVFRGQLAFSVPSSPRAEASIELCARLARAVADEHNLGYYDPQEGVTDY